MTSQSLMCDSDCLSHTYIHLVFSVSSSSSSWCVFSARRHRLRLRLPLLGSMSGSKHSLQDDTEFSVRMPTMGHESVALDKLISLPEHQDLVAAPPPLLLWDETARRSSRTPQRRQRQPGSPALRSPLSQGLSLSSPRLHTQRHVDVASSCESVCSLQPEPEPRRFAWDGRLPSRPSSTGQRPPPPLVPQHPFTGSPPYSLTHLNTHFMWRLVEQTGTHSFTFQVQNWKSSREWRSVL